MSSDVLFSFVREMCLYFYFRMKPAAAASYLFASAFTSHRHTRYNNNFENINENILECNDVADGMKVEKSNLTIENGGARNKKLHRKKEEKTYLHKK